MSMILGVNLNDSFFVGGIRVEVFDIASLTRFKIRVYKEYIDEVYTITDKKPVTILLNVSILAGNKTKYPKVTVVIKAHPSIKIKKKHKYYLTNTKNNIKI